MALPAGAEKDVAGKTYYTMANIWYENPGKIYSTNYHRGAILPAGTKVTVNNVSRKEISFTDKDGLDFRIVYVSKHSSRGATVWDHFDQYFSEEDPMGKNGPFGRFTKKEKDNIRQGVLAKGMSKDAALMAYGYPPSHKTPSISANQWTYWDNRFVTRLVLFVDDKISNVRQ
jgi:hypothetical protein